MMAAAAMDRTARAERHLALAGAWGAALTLVIVGLSVLVRLATRIEAGEAVSLLPAAVEAGVRIAHRIAATGVAVAAAVVLLQVVSVRPRAARRVLALAAILGLTLLLASIGRYTPGYRYAAVTVANVVSGTLLASAFWWVREDVRGAGGHAASPGVAWAALAALVGVSAMGASASALAMHGERSFGPAHLWVATLFLVLALVAAWRNRGRRALAMAVAVLATLQYAAGFLLLSRAFGALPIAFPWTHAMVAAALAPLLVSLAIRGRTPNPARPG